MHSSSTADQLTLEMAAGGEPSYLDDELVGGEVLADLNGSGHNSGLDDSEGLDEEHLCEEDEVALPARLVDDDSIHSFEGHTDSVLSVAWSPAHPDLVASGGQDETAFLWRVGQDAFESTAGTLSTAELSGHTDSVASLAFNCKGTLLATGGMEGCVKVWSSGDGRLLQTLEGPGGSVDWVRWHPKGDVVLAGSEDFSLWMWLAQTGTCMQVFSGHQGPVTWGAFSPDGKLVVSAGGDGDCSLRAWNPKTGECTAHIHGHGFHDAGITEAAVHSDCVTVISAAEDGTLRISNIATGKVLGALEGHEDSVETVGLSQHLPLAASAGLDRKLLVWDLASLGQRGACAHPDAVTRMCWHPTQPLVFTGCMDGMVRCWDLRTGSAVRQIGGHSAGIQDMALSPDGSMVITGSDDNTAKIFSFAG